MEKSTQEMLGSKLTVFSAMVLIVVPPFFRGLFFEREAFIHLILTTILFISYVYKTGRAKKNRILEGPVDLALVSWVVIYIIALSVSLNVRSSIGEVFRLLDYFMLYLIVKWTALNDNDASCYMKGIFFSGTGVSLFGIVAALGIINIEWAVQFDRIYSTIQYPNSLATLLMAIFFITVYLYVSETNNIWRIVYSVGSYIMLIAFWGTQSRINLMLLPLMYVVAVFGLNKKVRRVFVGFSMFQLLATIIISAQLMPFSEVPAVDATLWFVAGLFLTAMVPVLGKILRSKLPGFSVKVPSYYHRYIPVLILIIAVVGASMYITYSDKASFVFDDVEIASRVKSINFSDSSLQERITLYADAFKIIKDYPLLGTGGGGWKTVFYQYQGHYYQIADVHSSILDVWIDTGTIGLIIFISLWLFLLVRGFRLIRSNRGESDTSLSWISLVGALTIGSHAALDFDLSLGAISIILWTLIALSYDRLGDLNEGAAILSNELVTKGLRNLIVLFAIVSSIVAGIFWMGERYGEAGELAFVEEDYNAAKGYLEKARVLDPLSGRWDFHLGKTLGVIGEKGGDPQAFKQGLTAVEEAARKDSANADVHFLKAKLHLALSDYDNALKHVELTYKYSPYNQKALNYLTRMYLIAAKQYLEEGDKELGEKYLKKVINMPLQVKQMVQKLTPERRKVWEFSNPMITVSPEMQSDIKEAEALLKTLK